jgi:LGFP repeat
MGSKPVHGLTPGQVSEYTLAELQDARDSLARAKRQHMVSDNEWMKQFMAQMAAARHAIDAKFNALGSAPGAPQGVLEVGQGAGFGFYQVYQNGVIYWRTDIGAFWVHGSIHDKYRGLRGEGGFLGYPKTDETGVSDGVGRFNHFEGGSIYWYPSTGAFEVHGAIRDAWSNIGWETSFLGYPVSDEHYANGWRVSDFQNGTIRWSSQDGINIAPQQFVADAPSITFGSGISVGGRGTLVLYSDGTTHFSGHLHDSGFPSYDCLVVFTVKDADGRAYAASQTGRVHGTDESGSRDLDWDVWSTNEDVRKNWPKIRNVGTGGYKVDVTSDWSPQKIAEDVAAVVGVVLAVIALPFGGGGSSNKSNDPNYGRPEDFPLGGEPPPPGSADNPNG